MKQSSLYSRRKATLSRHNKVTIQTILRHPICCLLFPCFYFASSFRATSFAFSPLLAPTSHRFASQVASIKQRINNKNIILATKTLLWSAPDNDQDNDSDDDEDFGGDMIAPLDEFGGTTDIPLTRSEVESLTLPLLKQQLRLRGAKVSGKKQELVERLYAISNGRAENVELFTDENDDIRARKKNNGHADPTSKEALLEPEVVAWDKVVGQAKGRQAKAAASAAQGVDPKDVLVDVTAYLDEEDRNRTYRSLDDSRREDGDDSKRNDKSPEIWGSAARIVDDYEGRSVVVDNLSRTVVEFKGSNQTVVKAYVVASRDALKGYLAGGRAAKNATRTSEVELMEIQMRREALERKKGDDFEGTDEGDESGRYTNVVERDYGDWGAYTATGAQLSAAEVQGIILLSDVYGAFTADTKTLADKIAFECQPIVIMVPDVFRGHPWEDDPKRPGFNNEGVDYEKWRKKHAPELRVNIDIRAAAASLREQYAVKSIAVWGTGYGGGRALEAAAGYLPKGQIHDIDGRLGPAPVDPLAAVAWYPTRYDAEILFGADHQGSTISALDGKKRSVAIMAVFAGKDKVPGAKTEDAAKLKELFSADKRVKDHMVKVFPKMDHGFAHVGLAESQGSNQDDEMERFVDNEFGGSGRVALAEGDAEVASLLSTAWMETYTRVFLPTVGPPIMADEDKFWSEELEMKEFEPWDVRQEIKEQLENHVDMEVDENFLDPWTNPPQPSAEVMNKTVQIVAKLIEEHPDVIDKEDDFETMCKKLKEVDTENLLDTVPSLLEPWQAYVDKSSGGFW